METIILGSYRRAFCFRGYIGITEKKMETTIVGLYRV